MALERVSKEHVAHQDPLPNVLRLLPDGGQAYLSSSDAGRRDYNQAWFTGRDLDADDERQRVKVTSVARTPIFAAVQDCQTDLSEALANEDRRRGKANGGDSSVTASSYEPYGRDFAARRSSPEFRVHRGDTGR